jgi:hypothetical protein
LVEAAVRQPRVGQPSLVNLRVAQMRAFERADVLQAGRCARGMARGRGASMANESGTSTVMVDRSLQVTQCVSS